MKFETWVSLGSLALGIMFVVLILSFYKFLIGPGGNGPQISVDPAAVSALIVSIAGAPSLILAGVVLGISRSRAQPNTGLILISTGIILIIGMFSARTLLSKINVLFLIPGMDFVPPIFIIGGVGIAAAGSFILKNARRARQNSQDEIL